MIGDTPLDTNGRLDGEPSAVNPIDRGQRQARDRGGAWSDFWRDLDLQSRYTAGDALLK
ncbi:hypothetical protein WME76_20315 [Sorangium sp. So ce119]|uniref:hypothetical protein n=1 Tax=Sorangium sp. So ce119 TaxID=3133279 RepID=UPI003F615C25